MNVNKSTCYMCDDIETSREHAPPKCLFPEVSDIGRNLRRNLKTVPSCEAHNLKKSEEDEFLRAVILHVAASSNKIAEHQFLGKFLRGVERSSRKYSSFVTNKGVVANRSLRVLQLDRNRFDSCIDHIVRALFFDQFQLKWNLPIVVISPNFYSSFADQSLVLDIHNQKAVDVSRELLAMEPILGANPEVFKYRLHHNPKTDMLAFEGIFYDFFEVYSWSSPELAHVIHV